MRQLADRAEQEQAVPAGDAPQVPVFGDSGFVPSARPPDDSLATVPLSANDRESLQAAEHSLDDVSTQLLALRKPAGRLDRQVDLDIEIAVTRALCGQPGDAIAALDQIARTRPKSDTSARARYEIGEIYRRLGEFEKSRRAYDDAIKEKQGTPITDSAQRKSTAIVVRSQAVESLQNAPQVLARWDAVRGEPLPDLTAGTDSTTVDGVGERIKLESQFEELARQQLRVAEIDLFDLDQPLVALREFQEVLDRYDGSLQEARAAFGVAWIYHQKLNDRDRARQAYEVVARNHADSPQGKEAQAILDHWAENPQPEVPEPSRP
jgi:tetratricopeptide (TPR) repeat protein